MVEGTQREAYAPKDVAEAAEDSRTHVNCGPFRAQRLSSRVWCIVEEDRFGERPHVYAVIGNDKIIVVDTGCNSGDIRNCLRLLPRCFSLDFLVINTHVHYDHIMGNHCFCSQGGFELRTDCIAICQGARDCAFSKDWARTSLQDTVGATICPFCVTRWLGEDDRVYLDDASPSEDESLQVIYTPGHTPDSISLYYAAEDRLFTGDLIYPGPLYLFLPGSSLEDFAESLGKLRMFIAGKGGRTTLSCGHNAFELPASALDELYELLRAIQDGTATPDEACIPWFQEPVVVYYTAMFNILCRKTHPNRF